MWNFLLSSWWRTGNIFVFCHKPCQGKGFHFTASVVIASISIFTFSCAWDIYVLRNLLAATTIIAAAAATGKVCHIATRTYITTILLVMTMAARRCYHIKEPFSCLGVEAW